MFVRNDSSDTYPKCSAVTGSVNTVTPADIVTEASTYLTGRHFMRSGSLFIAASKSFPEKHIIPAIAPKLSWRLILAAAYGFESRISARIAESEVTASFSRRSTGAISSIDCMKPALTADGLAPVTSTKSHTSAMQITALLLPLPRTNCSSPTRNETCIPDTATMCMNPARDIVQ